MKKAVVVLLCTLAVASSCRSGSEDQIWVKLYNEVEASVTEPSFRGEDYNIVEFLADPGNTAELNHYIINRAIEACSYEGGGRVVIPAGTWHTGPIRLLSDVDLHLEEGAVLKFSAEAQYYEPVRTSWRGIECMNTHPAIYAVDASNIAVTGKGTIDLDRAGDNWGRPLFTVYDDLSESSGWEKLSAWQVSATPVADRVLGPADGLMPAVMDFYECSNVLVEGLTVVNSPSQVVFPHECTNITVRGVEFSSSQAGKDIFVNPENSRGVVVGDCVFSGGRYAVLVAAGEERTMTSGDIIIRNCRMEGTGFGVAVEYIDRTGVKNIFMENCIFSGDTQSALAVSSSACEGGEVKGLYARNLTVDTCLDGVVSVRLEPDQGCTDVVAVSDVRLSNIVSGHSRYAVALQGVDGAVRIDGVSVTDCRFDNAVQGNYITGEVSDVTFSDTFINGVAVEESR